MGDEKIKLEIQEILMNEQAKIKTLPEAIARIHQLVGCLLELDDRIANLEKTLIPQGMCQ